MNDAARVAARFDPLGSLGVSGAAFAGAVAAANSTGNRV